MTVNTSVEKALDRIKAMLSKTSALSYVSSIMFWDASTGAPKSGADRRSETVGTISGYEYENFINDTVASDLDLLMSNLDALSPIEQTNIKKLKKNFDQMTKIPADEYQAFSALLSKSSMVWEEAKEEADFNKFKPYLEQVVGYLLKFADLRGYEGHPYNLYIDDYEEGMTVDKLDAFFDTLRERIVPLLKRVVGAEKQVENSFLYQSFPVAEQEALSLEVLKQIGFDLNRGMFKESVHPFTMGLDMDDVRLTTHYYEKDFTSALLSTIHEGGHGIYEQNIDKALKGMPVGHAASSGIHESQSRIYENNFAKSKAFLSHLYPRVKEQFKHQFENVSFDSFYTGMNKVTPSLIRTDADELTYCLHVMIRYEIELGLIEGSIQVEDLPKVWNQKMNDYLGVVPSHDGEGVLQDVHWSEALFGYFPTYAIGTALSAQLEHYMRKELDVDAHLQDGVFEPLTKWLNEKVHRHGSTMTPTQLIEAITGEGLNAMYYCDYLERKYSEIYNLN